MQLTERCNNNCIHCCINQPADDLLLKEKELSTKEIKNILQEAATLGYLTVRFTGGEPLLRDDFSELYVFARKLGIKVMLFTNATLITPQLIELFARIPPLEKIEVSVYGMHKKSYEAVSRVSGSYEPAWRGINLLLENKIPFIVKGSLLPPNKKEIDEFRAWAKKIPWMIEDPLCSMFFDLRCRRDSKEKNQMIKKLRPSAKEGLTELTCEKEGYKKRMKEFCSKFIGPKGDTLFVCGVGVGGGSVDPYGYYFPCLVLMSPETGYYLKEGSLKDALECFSPKIRKIKATNPAYLSRCARCFLKGLCDQCPAKSYMENGTLDTPVEYLCEITHLQASYLGLINKGEKTWEVKDWQERISKF
ncbi:MAG: radical SAM protein [Candidatus Saganbacteria bacterium]|nr:radical SAM protein [Candidatus Saganbacteria bacterium]